ncbi:TVP38/TMEM64 family protein [Pararhizobium haloflavum]|uniref:TVP38/TMEM64 family protein n=1 Tax=Pararhizobium haloflavum TaxID=2037914 RepID=UPI000C18FBFC|nr:TVP38/TMEM64 family protein [Pararhizobium haloflavum]
MSRQGARSVAQMNERPNGWPRALKFLPIMVILFGLTIGYLLGLHQYLTLDALAERRLALLGYVEANRLLAVSLYFVVYLLAVAFAFPAASVLTIFGGFLFGWLTGGIVTALAATLGATVLFIAARSALSDLLRRKLGPRLERLRSGFSEDAFSYLLVLRLAPVFPFFLVNIAPAFFGVRTRTYMAATLLGILPGTFAYAYLGAGIDSVLAAAAEAGRSVTLADIVTPKITIAFLLLAAVAALPVVIRKLRLLKRP